MAAGCLFIFVVALRGNVCDCMAFLFTFALLITGTIALSARHHYLSYSEGDCEVFCPTVATHCTDRVKFGMEDSMPNFTANGVMIRV